jgi:hypothetical protein
MPKTFTDLKSARARWHDKALAELKRAEEQAESGDFSHATMPFGKHKGTLIRDLPTHYLRWIVENTDIDGWVAEAAHQALTERQ